MNRLPTNAADGLQRGLQPTIPPTDGTKGRQNGFLLTRRPLTNKKEATGEIKIQQSGCRPMKRLSGCNQRGLEQQGPTKWLQTEN